MQDEGRRRPQRAQRACANCRKKKQRCPGERPACSTCKRLGHVCSYRSTTSTSLSTRSEDRLAHIEEQLNVLLNNTRSNSRTRTDDEFGSSHVASTVPNCPEARSVSTNMNATLASAVTLISLPDNLQYSWSDLDSAIKTYFECCHRQPIWLFEPEEVVHGTCLDPDLACIVLALSACCKGDSNRCTLYVQKAREFAMAAVTNGSVSLSTIQTLCLLSYYYSIDGTIQLTRFHLSLALQLCESAMLDQRISYGNDDGSSEQKKRLFWSLQLLLQSHEQHDRLSYFSTRYWRPSFLPTTVSHPESDSSETRYPPFPKDDTCRSIAPELGIWSLSVHLGWIWSRTRAYIYECAGSRLKEPWRHDSTYTIVSADLMEEENWMPSQHRYHTARYYKRSNKDLEAEDAYWKPWLRSQVLFHLAHTILNHPLIYIIASQHNDKLRIPHSFWRRSSELALLHATWVVRILNLAFEKGMQLYDPFFGHAAAVAATVHLYYSLTADPRLRSKSQTDLERCRKFLKSFMTFSRSCYSLDETLESMSSLALNRNTTMDASSPPKMILSSRSVWKILFFDVSTSSGTVSSDSLLSSSLRPAVEPYDGLSDDTIEIVINASPHVIFAGSSDAFENADDGRSTLATPTLGSNPPTHEDSGPSNVLDSMTTTSNSLMLENSWLWNDASHFMMDSDMHQYSDGSGIGGTECSTWWNFGHL